MSPDETANFRALVDEGLRARTKGMFDIAIDRLRSACALRPDSASARCELAFTLQRASDLAAAEVEYRAVLAQDDGVANAWAGLGQLARRRADPREALQHFRKAESCDPGHIGFKTDIAAILRELAEPQAALDIIEDILARAPDTLNAWTELGLIRRGQNDRQAALAAFLRAAEIRPERALIEAAAEYQALAQPDSARAALRQLLAAAPQDYLAQTRLIELELRRQDFAACLVLCDVLIAGHPTRVLPYRLKCRALIRLNNLDEAGRIMREIGAVLAPSVELDAARLEILRSCGDRAEIETMLLATRADSKKNFDFWIEWSATQLALGNLVQVAEALRDAPAGRPAEHARVRMVQGQLADLQWDLAGAADAFEAALSLHPHDQSAHHHLARLRLLLIDPDRAAIHLQMIEAAKISKPQAPAVSINLAHSLTGQLLYELNMDKNIRERIIAIRALSADERVPHLFEIVRAAPNLTPPALYLLLALRQSGELHKPQPATTDLPSVLPRRIMQYWHGADPPDGIRIAMQSWQSQHKDFEYCYFDRRAAHRLLMNEFPKDVAHAYSRAIHAAQAADIFSLAYLNREGGFFVAAELRCVEPIRRIAGAADIFVARQEQFATLGNGFLGCEPGDAVIERALNLAVEAVNRGDRDIVWLSTGPGLLTRAFAQVLAEQGESWRPWLTNRQIR